MGVSYHKPGEGGAMAEVQVRAHFRDILRRKVQVCLHVFLDVGGHQPWKGLHHTDGSSVRS